MNAIDAFIRAGGASSERALELLHLTGRPIRTRDLLEEPLSRDEIKRLAALAGGLRHIISTRAPAFRRHALARPNVLEPELLHLMLIEPDLHCLSDLVARRSSLDHLVRPLHERRRNDQAEGLGGLEVDDQLNSHGLLDR